MKEIVENLKSYFMKEEYQFIETDIPDVLMYAIMYDEYLYLINVISLGENTTFDVNKFQGYKKELKQQFAYLDSDKIVLLNIVLCEYPYLYYHAFNYLADLKDGLIDIHWLIDIKKRKLIIPSKQIKTLIGIDKEIKDILKNKLGKQKWKIPQIPKWTGVILSINFIVWLISMNLDQTMLERVITLGGNYSIRITAHYEVYRLITSLFVHLQWGQLLFTSTVIAFIAPPIERLFKSYDFWIIYLFSGFVGNAVIVFESIVTGTDIVNISAFPAVYGLLGAGFAIAKHQLKQTRTEQLILYGAIVIAGFLNGMIQSGIRNTASMWGMLSGFLVCTWLLRQYLILEAKYEGRKA